MKQVKGNSEYIYPDEYQVIYQIVESLYSTAKTNLTLYANYNGILLKAVYIKLKFNRVILFANS